MNYLILLMILLSSLANSAPQGRIMIVPNEGAVIFSDESKRQKLTKSLGISMSEFEPVVEVFVGDGSRQRLAT